MRTHSVYVARGNGHVLYVGSTSRGMVRLHEHAGTAEWWPLVTSMSWLHRSSRRAALETERRLIRQLRPLFNEQSI